MSKHIPGPWGILAANNYNGFAIAPMGTLPTLAAVERMAGNKDLITINCFNFPGETKANARLIAAAPELLELLETWFDGRPCPGREEIRALISKAKGEPK